MYIRIYSHTYVRTDSAKCQHVQCTSDFFSSYESLYVFHMRYLTIIAVGYWTVRSVYSSGTRNVFDSR